MNAPVQIRYADVGIRGAKGADVEILGNTSVTAQPGGDYESVEEALEFFRYAFVEPPGLLTINFTGLQELTTGLVIDHPCAHRMRLLGTNEVVATVKNNTAWEVASNGAGDHFVTFQTTAAHGVEAGEWIALDNMAGRGPVRELEGMLEVLEVESDVITFRCYSRNATIAQFVPSSATNIIRMNSILKWSGADIKDARYFGYYPFTSDPAGLDIRAPGFRFDKIGLIGDASPITGDADANAIISRQSNATALWTEIGIANWRKNGLWCLFNSYHAGNKCWITNVFQGIIGQLGGTVNFSNPTITGCVSSPARYRDKGLVILPSMRVGGNGSGALTGEGAGYGSSAGLKSQNNLLGELRCDTGGQLDVPGADVSTNSSAQVIKNDAGGKVNAVGATLRGGYIELNTASGADVSQGEVDSRRFYGPYVITGITRANPAVVTIAGHEIPNGTRVFIEGVAGMTQVNKEEFATANAATDTFQLQGIDSSAYTAYSSGGSLYIVTDGQVGTIYTAKIAEGARLDATDTTFRDGTAQFESGARGHLEDAIFDTGETYALEIKSGAQVYADGADLTGQVLRLDGGNVDWTSTAPVISSLSVTSGRYKDRVIGKIVQPPKVYGANVDLTLTPGTSATVYKLTGTITTNRTVTLGTATAIDGDTFFITRTGAGAFDWDVGGLVNLGLKGWCIVIYDDATGWYLAASGTNP